MNKKILLLALASLISSYSFALSKTSITETAEPQEFICRKPSVDYYNSNIDYYDNYFYIYNKKGEKMLFNVIYYYKLDTTGKNNNLQKCVKIHSLYNKSNNVISTTAKKYSLDTDKDISNYKSKVYGDISKLFEKQGLLLMSLAIWSTRVY